MLIANLMFGNVSATQCSSRISGSDISDGPENVSPEQLLSAPKYPSKIEPTELLRLRSTPQLLRPPIAPVVAVIGQ
jgi:hypothetical protein